MTYRLGIDCGGTNTKLLIMADQDGVPVEIVKRKLPTPHESDGLCHIATAARDLVGDYPVSAFGITIPGIVEAESGTVVTSVNLPWMVGERPVDVIEESLGCPGTIVNDGVAAAQAEVALGAGRGQPDVFVIALGTGVAGAHVVNGTVRRGAHGAAGEIGHISQGGDLLCACGQHGCLETIIGSGWLAARWAEEIGMSPTDVTSNDLMTSASAGTPAALAILDEATSALARGILGLIALVDPGLIVIGGGVGRNTDLIVTPTRKKTNELATFHEVPDIVPAALGIWGAAWGAAQMATDAHA